MFVLRTKFLKFIEFNCTYPSAYRVSTYEKESIYKYTINHLQHIYLFYHLVNDHFVVNFVMLDFPDHPTCNAIEELIPAKKLVSRTFIFKLNLFIDFCLKKILGVCTVCGRGFTRSNKLVRHMRYALILI